MSRKHFAAEFACTLGILIALIAWSQHLLRPSNTDQCIAAIEAFHNMPDDSVEVMIYGSSHAWRGVNILEMYDKYGIGAYNYGTNWQKLSTEALFFYDSLRTQSPKVVLFETFYIDRVIIDQYMDGEIYYTRAIPDSPQKRQYLRRAFGDESTRYLSYYFPLSQFHSAWTDIGIDSFKTFYSRDEFEDTMGYFYVPEGDTSVPVTIHDSSTFQQKELNEDTLRIMDDIVATCKDGGIELIFFTVPWAGENQFSDALSRYAEENDCVYLDLFQHMNEIELDTEADFTDIGHLSHSGATKVADYLGSYLNEHYTLSDMRLVNGNPWLGRNNEKIGKEYLKWHEIVDK